MKKCCDLCKLKRLNSQLSAQLVALTALVKKMKEDKRKTDEAV